MIKDFHLEFNSISELWILRYTLPHLSWVSIIFPTHQVDEIVHREHLQSITSGHAPDSRICREPQQQSGHLATCVEYNNDCCNWCFGRMRRQESWMWLIDTGNILHHGGTSGIFTTAVSWEGILYYGRLIIIFSLLSTFQHALCRYRLPNPHDQRHYTSIFQERLHYLTMPALGLEICCCNLT